MLLVPKEQLTCQCCRTRRRPARFSYHAIASSHATCESKWTNTKSSSTCSRNRSENFAVHADTSSAFPSVARLSQLTYHRYAFMPHGMLGSAEPRHQRNLTRPSPRQRKSKRWRGWLHETSLFQGSSAA